MIVELVNCKSNRSIRVLRLDSAADLLALMVQAIQQGWNVRLHVRALQG